MSHRSHLEEQVKNQVKMVGLKTESGNQSVAENKGPGGGAGRAVDQQAPRRESIAAAAQVDTDKADRSPAPIRK